MSNRSHFVSFLIFCQLLIFSEAGTIFTPKTSRIIQGHPAAEKQFPWQATVASCSALGCNACGGSLISPRHVLTAAHCTYTRYRFNIGLGSNQWHTPQISLTSYVNYQHSQYKQDGLQNDISIIELPYDVPLNESIQIIKLAGSDIGDLVGKDALVSGFGKTAGNGSTSTTLNFLRMQVVTNDVCAKAYGEWGQKNILENNLCAVGEVRDKQTVCQGDSGGPLVAKDGEKYVQIGVVSFTGGKMCSPRNPSGYARVSSFIDWIREKTKLDL